MKKRIRIDSALLGLALAATGVLYRFPGLYLRGPLVDDLLDVVGMGSMLVGVFLRMAARGYKKAGSQAGGRLVTGGLYACCRNPMYLGSFLLGCGFVLIAWPCWAVPVFAAGFYARFIRQIRREEAFLSSAFGEEYGRYMREVPRIFPRPSSFVKAAAEALSDPGLLWSTKERRALFLWPLVVWVLEILQHKAVFGLFIPWRILSLFAGTMGAFAVGASMLGRRAGVPREAS